MSHPFEGLPTTPTAEEVVDKAFSRASRAGGAKSGVEAQQSMLQTASNVVADNLDNVVSSWPDFDELDPFYRELLDAVAGRALPQDPDDGVDALRQHLSEVGWAAHQTRKIRGEYQGRLHEGGDSATKFRKQAFARMADVVDEVADDLQAISTARDALKGLPDIRPDEPTIVVAGYPNVGKSTFVNAVTNADNEIASYPFTTTEIRVGHVTRDRIRYQLVDTPGLLDRPADERNEIESQAVSALTHLADCVVVMVDPSEECGYPLELQLELRDSIEDQFDVTVLTVATKSDRSTDVEADEYVSVTEEDNVEGTLAAAIDAVGYEIELPYDDGA